MSGRGNGIFAATGFVRYLAVAFLNAFVDLGHKIVIQNTVFKVYDGSTQIVLIAVVNALILLPFVLLFRPAGSIGDRFGRHLIMRWTAAAALLLTLGITFCYYQGWFWAAFGFTFALAMQSAIYSPAKYGYIPDILGSARLAAGNGAVQAVTIVAILSGTLVFSIAFEFFFAAVAHWQKDEIMQVIAPIGWMLVGLSALELLLAWRLPARRAAVREDTSSQVREPALRPLWNTRDIGVAVLGLTVFMAVSQLMLAAYPAFAKARLGELNTVVVQATLAASGVGIVIGALLVARFSRGRVDLAPVPFGAAGIALGLLLLPVWGNSLWHAAMFLAVGVAGGLFIVPLNALIQYRARPAILGRVLAANNLVQNLGMLTVLALTALVAAFGLESGPLLSVAAVLALLGCGAAVGCLPRSLDRLRGGRALQGRRLEVENFDAVPGSGAVQLWADEGESADRMLLQMACARPLRTAESQSGGGDSRSQWLQEGAAVLSFGAAAPPLPGYPVVRVKVRQELQCLRVIFARNN